jgi:hypothetical protein
MSQNVPGSKPQTGYGEFLSGFPQLLQIAGRILKIRL